VTGVGELPPVAIYQLQVKQQGQGFSTPDRHDCINIWNSAHPSGEPAKELGFDNLFAHQRRDEQWG